MKKVIGFIVLLVVAMSTISFSQNDPARGYFWTLKARTSFTSVGTSSFNGVATFDVAPVFTLYPTFSTVTSGIDSFTTTGATDSITVGADILQVQKFLFGSSIHRGQQM